ncbi:cytosol non-specific dipeptidase [Lactobacillus delbrueckii subsp. jakobsenii ZN7a-9 = DSM 26046]|nr:cytosol non-specific dipeptidase [Lactobacillus delbrueckii subsp. jakobsenii ZN7a-9 = DSM 26046]KRO18980.1 cytosol non-specific dipeptidase [Lactobacillus delbrueckii subsp. jakobsenii ZN7a-9 = DSM 26046]
MIGKKASLDGSVIIGRNEDSRTAWPKHLAFHQRQAGAQTFKSHDNKFTIDLPEEAFAYSSTPEWTKKYGLFEEDGINEYHVAMSATESAYANERVLAIDPFDAEKGLLEEAMVTIVLPYVKTAQEGVKRLGEIVEKYGAAESNGILFADRDEAWYLEIGSGHHWVAQRIPDDSYTVVANQLSIQEIDFKDPANFLYSAGLQEFVYEHQLWPKEAKFNWREIFGTRSESDLHYNTPRVWYGQKLLTPSVKQEPQSFDLPFIQKADRPLSVQDAQTVLASHYSDTEYDLTNPKNAGQASFRPIGVATTQESHLLQLKGEDMYHWLAMGVTAQSVYIPFFPQGTKVPYMWGNGKVDYSPNSAYWIFKLAGVLVDRNWGKYGKELANAQTEAKEKVLRLRYEYDQKLHADPSQATAIADEANAKMAKTVTDIYNKLISSLITQQTSDSPLSFQMDPNL